MLNHPKHPLSKHGLSVFVLGIPESAEMASLCDLRLICEQDIINGNRQLGLGYLNKPVSSLWAGSTDEIRNIRARYRAEFSSKNPGISVMSLGDCECNWLQGAGYQAVDKYLDGQAGLLTFFQESVELSPIESANLGKLREKAKGLGCHVVVFMIAREKFSTAALKGMVDNLIAVEPCEPDPRWQWAISIAHVSQGYFSTSRGKWFCQFSPTPDAFPEAAFEPFLAADIEVRIQWHMHEAGTTMKDIAEAFDCDKSTISRNLKHLPKNQKSWLSEDQIHELLDSILGVQSRQPKTSNQETLGEVKEVKKVKEFKDDNERPLDDPDDDEDNEFWDPPKHQPKHKKTRW